MRWQRTPWQHEDGPAGWWLSACELGMMVIAAVMMFSTCGCWPGQETSPPDVVTARGVRVWLHGQFLETSGTTWDEMDGYMDRMSPYSGFEGRPTVDECQRRVKVGVFVHSDLVQEFLSRGGAFNTSVPNADSLGGFFDEPSWTVFIEPTGDQKNPWPSAYVHEQTHMLQWCWSWPGDADHTKYVWQWDLVARRPGAP